MIPLSDDQPTTRAPVMTLALIAINVAVFALWQQGQGVDQSVSFAGFIPLDFTAKTPGAMTHIFTSMFMHGGWMHLIGNMWFLWIFGKNVEDVCGHLRYVCFYLLCGAAATFLYTIASPYSGIPLVGASGAISGVLGAFLLKFPKANVRALIPMGLFTRVTDVPAFLFLLVWFGLQFWQHQVSHYAGQSGGVAYMAHIGGFIAGMVLIFIFQEGAADRAALREDTW